MFELPEQNVDQLCGYVVLEFCFKINPSAEIFSFNLTLYGRISFRDWLNTEAFQVKHAESLCIGLRDKKCVGCHFP